MPKISWDQFNDGDVFILDAGTYVFLWAGRNANNMEKIQAIRVAQQLKAEHGSACESVVIVDDGSENKDLVGGELDIFEKYLPLDEKDVKSQDEVPRDETSVEQRRELKLYRCSDEDGTLKVTEVKSGPLEQSDLESQVSPHLNTVSLNTIRYGGGIKTLIFIIMHSLSRYINIIIISINISTCQ